MEKISTIVSTAYPLPVKDVDTDQIIPARFLKATSREGFGEKLFNDWRYNTDGSPKADFVLNDAKYSGTILVADNNFGCGSSREHAVWALYDFGFRVVISPGFADIFKGNSLNNGMLPVALPADTVQHILDTVAADPSAELTVKLEEQEVWLAGEKVGEFEINPYKKHCLQNGFDDTDYLLSILDEVEQYENQRVTF